VPHPHPHPKEFAVSIKTPIIARAAIAAALVFAAPLVLAQNIAVVNGKTVSKARFDAMMTQVVKQGQPRTPEVEAKVKEQLVLREIFAQEAEKRGLAATPEYRDQMELARQSVLIQTLFADFEKKNPMTEAEAKAEYDRIKAAGGDKEYRARHILVEKEEDAKAIIAELKAGAKFEDLAKKNSKDPGSAENGGDLDWAPPSNYVAEFSQAMTKLEKGAFTQEPVKSQFGYHIIKLEDTRANQSLPPYAEVKDQLIQHYTQVKLGKFRDELKKKAKTDFKFSE
jgi:peptidyl-prolyl cis-trans isomerase C